jgi:parvulin-like peptidyl-prolyl isomerase
MAGAALALGLAGCGVVGPRSTVPNDFYSSPSPVAGDVRSPNDQGGGFVYSGSQVVAYTAPSDSEPRRDDTISPTVQQAATQTSDLGSNATGIVPATAPSVLGQPAVGPVTQPTTAAIGADAGNGAGGATTLPAGAIGPGQYLVVGAVVASVNTTPIYANKVVAFLEPSLRNLAREDDPETFRRAAGSLIQDAVQRQINDELVYTAATQNLNDEQKSRAKALTTEWYERQITDAGGSLELARQRALASGTSLEDQTQGQYRKLMTDIYREYTLIPHIQVTAQMMRDYYAQHREDLFTQSDHADFYLIEIDPANEGGKSRAQNEELALDKLQYIRKLIAGGEAFSVVAASNNDSPVFKNRAKSLQPFSFDMHSFAIAEVDKAVFSLQPGQVSDVIPAQGKYFLAEVEARTVGKVLPFDDPSVQDQIDRKLRGEQFEALQRDQTAKLISEAAVTRYQDMYEATLEMVMQNYATWRGK